MTPIYEKTLYSEQEPFFEYHLDCEDKVLYAGKAYKKPDSDETVIKVNDIAADYLKNEIAFESTNPMPDYCKTFTLTTSTGNSTNYTFYNDYSYKGNKKLLNDPILPSFDSRQYLFATCINKSNNRAEMGFYPNGVLDRKTYVEPNKAVTIAGKYNAPKVTVQLDEDGIEYINYTLSCSNYCLYYINAYGGWDSLLVNSRGAMIDNCDTYSYYNEQRKDYLKINRRSWELNSPLLTERQAIKLHHLICSTCVYLHCLDNDEIIPVTIKTSSVRTELGTNRFQQLTVEVEEAIEKVRK